MKRELVNNGWRDKWLLAVVLAAVGALFWAANWEADTEERDHLALFHKEVADKAQISEAIITTRLRAYDDTLLALREIYAADSAQFDKRMQWLRSGPLADREILIVVLDREGYLAYTDSPGVRPRLDLRQRAYFRYFADGGKDRFYVDEPAFGRVTRRYSLPLARPIYDRNGAFYGVVALSIRQDSLANFDPDLQLSGDTAISVVTERGALVTRSRDLAKVQGWTMPPEMLAKLLQGKKGVFSSASNVHGDERILAFRHIEGLPLIVYASSSPRQALDSIAQQRTLLMSSAGVVSLLLLLLAAAYLQRQQIAAKFIATQRAHLKEAQRIAGMGSWELDLSTYRFNWSDEMYEIVGVSREDVDPDFENFLSRVVESDRAAVKGAIEKAGIDGTGEIEFSLHREGGQRREMLARFEAVRNKAGEAASLIGTVRDITERKQSDAALRESESRFRLTFELAGSGIAHVNLDGYFLRVNRSLCAILGYSEKELIRHTVKQLSHPEDRDKTDAARARVHSGELESTRFQKRYLRKDGATVWVDLTIALVRDTEGKPLYEIAVFDDITELKQAEHAMRESAEELRVFTDNVPAMTSAFDENLRLVFVNKRYTDFFGHGAGEVLGKHLREVLGERVYKEVAGYFAQALQGHPVTYQRTRKFQDGESLHLEVRLLPHIGDQGKILGCFAVTTDITEHVLAEERIKRMAHHDSLTGLPNRLLFNDRLAQAISLAKRDSRQFALLYLDLDKFKQVNDTLGHAAGDELLQGVAVRIRQQVRESDTVARVGGDEFTVILPDIERREEAETVARKIIAALAAPFELGSQKQRVNIGTSIGIAVYPADAQDADTLVQAADAVMYSSKQAGAASGLRTMPDR